MSTLKTINIVHPSGSTTNIVNDSSGNMTVGGTMAMSSSFMRNRIINGAMVVDQRNAGASVTPTTSSTYTLDRWITFLSQSSKFSVQQTPSATETGYATRVAAGFTNYLAATSLSAYTVGASEQFGIAQVIEGFNIADLAWGTASAKTITLTFWAYSSLTGTFGGSLNNSGNSRCYPFTYTIGSANTWTQINVVVAGDTSGTWLTNNGQGVTIRFSLGAGATVSGTAGTWSGTTYYSATGATSVVGTNGATFYITGVQLEVGSVATPFEREIYSNTLAKCQRYCPVFDASSGTGARLIGVGRGTTNADVFFQFLVQPRVPATGATVSSVSDFSIFNPGNSGTGSPTAIAFSLSGITQCTLYTTSTAGTPTIAAGSFLQLYPLNTNAKIIFTGCEL